MLPATQQYNGVSSTAAAIHSSCVPLLLVPETTLLCVSKKKKKPLQPLVILSERHIGHLSRRICRCLPSSLSVSWVAIGDGLLLAVIMGFFWGQVGLPGCVKWFIRQARADVQQATQIVCCHFCFDDDSQSSGWGCRGGGRGDRMKWETHTMSICPTSKFSLRRERGAEERNAVKWTRQLSAYIINGLVVNEKWRASKMNSIQAEFSLPTKAPESKCNTGGKQPFTPKWSSASARLAAALCV